MTGTDWRHRGACRNEDPELFFPAGESERYEPQTEEAKAVCRGCPVMELCGQWALENRLEYGVWGGLSENERRSIRRQSGRKREYRRPAECGTRGGYKKHVREHTAICAPCRAANSEYGADLYHRNKQAAA